MWKLIWSNIIRRKNQSLLTIMSFVLVLGVFTAMGQGLELSEQRLGADVIFLPEEVDTEGYELLFTAQPESHYMDISIFEQIAAMDEVAQVSPQFYSQTIGGVTPAAIWASPCALWAWIWKLISFSPASPNFLGLI